MSCDLLQRLSQERHLDVHELADLLNLSTSSAYRYFGETELRYSQLRTLVRHCRSRAAKLALVRPLLDGTGIQCIELDARLDLDGDHDVDTDDAIAGCIRAARQTAELLEQIYTAMADRKVDRDERDQITRSIDELMQLLFVTQRIVNDQAERVRRRRQARPLQIGGTR